jgi:hypothetical protein
MQGPVAELSHRSLMDSYTYRSGNTSLLQKTCWQKSKKRHRESGAQNVQENTVSHQK